MRCGDFTNSALCDGPNVADVNYILIQRCRGTVSCIIVASVFLSSLSQFQTSSACVVWCTWNLMHHKCRSMSVLHGTVGHFGYTRCPWHPGRLQNSLRLWEIIFSHLRISRLELTFTYSSSTRTPSVTHFCVFNKERLLKHVTTAVT